MHMTVAKKLGFLGGSLIGLVFLVGIVNLIGLRSYQATVNRLAGEALAHVF